MGTDLTANVVLNGNTVNTIYNGSTELEAGTDYVVQTDNDGIAGSITFKSTYLNSLDASETAYIFTISYNPMGESYNEENTDAPKNTTVSVTVNEAQFVMNPSVSLKTGTYKSNQSVALVSATEGAHIYYTVYGSEPDISKVTAGSATKEYTGKKISVTGIEGKSISTTIKAVAVKEGMKNSEVMTFTYVVAIPVKTYSVIVDYGNGDGAYAANTTVRISADAAPVGKVFDRWLVVSGGVKLTNAASSTTTFTMTAKPIKVTALYKDKIQKGSEVKDTTGNKYVVTSAVAGSHTLEFKTEKKNIKTLKIPDTVKVNGVTYKVTSVAANLCKNNTKITKIVIGKNVKEIGTKAFYGCTSVKQVVIPDNVKTIGNLAFYKMKALKKVTIGKGVVSIGRHAFCHSAKGCVITINSTKLKTVKTAQNHGTRNMVIKVPKSKLKAYKKLFKKSTGVKVIAK